jgi:hypothetical protein
MSAHGKTPWVDAHGKTPWVDAHGKTPWVDAHGHSPPAGMKIFPISKTADKVSVWI